jgi:hypothetical protein
MTRHLNKGAFLRIVNELGVSTGRSEFSYWDHLLTLIYAQFSASFSLREIQNGLKALGGEALHAGITTLATKSSLSRANETRSPEVFEKFFHVTANEIREIIEKEMESGSVDHLNYDEFKFDNPAVAIDASIVELAVSLYDWGKYSASKAAFKLTGGLDLVTCLPRFFSFKSKKPADIKELKELDLHNLLGPGAIVVLDRGYVDFLMFCRWIEQGIFFVIRPKKNMNITVVEDRVPPRPVGRPRSSDGGNKRKDQRGYVVKDQTVVLGSPKSWKKCPHRLRMVTYFDAVGHRYYTYLTNNFKLSAQTIADLYKARWRIEAFFKDLKQHLKLKTFYGTSENAVKIQIWTALTAMLLLRFIQFISQSGMGLSNVIAEVRLLLHGFNDIMAMLRFLGGVWKPKPPEPEGPVFPSLFEKLERRDE